MGLIQRRQRVTGLSNPRRCATLPAFLASAVLLGLVAACASSATVATSPTPAPSARSSPSPSSSPSQSPSTSPSDTASGSSAAGTAHISLPAHWQEVGETDAAMQAQLQAVLAANPQMEQTLNYMVASWYILGNPLTTSANDEVGDIQIIAFDLDGDVLLGSLLVIPISLGGPSLNALVPVIEGEFKQLGATDFKASTATVLGVKATVLDVRLAPQAGGGPGVSGAARLYLVPVAHTAYEVTISCFGTDATLCLADGDKMVHAMTVGQ